MSISDQERKYYEQYLLSSTDEERQEAIKKLIPGSSPYYHLYFLDLMNRQGAKFSSADSKSNQDMVLLQQFVEKYRYQPQLQQIEARLLFLSYDEAKTEDEKQNVIQQIKAKYIQANLDHYKPEDLARQNDSQSSQSEDEEQSHTLGSGTTPGGSSLIDIGIKPKNSNAFDYESYFSKQIILSRVQGIESKEYESRQALNIMPKNFYQEINFKTYHPTAVYQWAADQGSILSDLDNQSFFETLKIYFENLQKNLKKNQQLPLIDKRICDSLTLKQLDRFSSIYPDIKQDKNYIGGYFSKLFNEELSESNQEIWSLEEKRANLERLYSYAKGNDMPKGLQSSLLLEILELGIKIGVYDEILFKQYLEIPLVVQANVFKNVKSQNADAHWNSYIGNVQSAEQRNNQWHKSQSSLIEKYLEFFCYQKNGSLSDYIDEFDTIFLQSIEEKISVYSSDDMTNLKVDLKKYQSISQEVVLRFMDSNKEIFKVDEEVSLQIELKNIQTLYTKIFEFNTETYYKKTLQPFNTGVNLDGLVASDEKQFDYKYPPNKKFTETFKFQELNGKVGLFIVEFIGNGMSGRAVIKKGSLSFIHKPTIAGHLAYVLDENKQICKGQKTGLYFDGQYYKADSEKNGKIFIPYGKSKLSSKVILMNNGFAQMTDFERQTEIYEFTALIALNPESILIGNKAQILIKPALKINSRVASVELLKHSKITLTTMNYIENIPVTKKFENLTFRNDKELIIDFQVPPYLDSINVLLETEVKNITHQRFDKFQQTMRFQINTHKSTTNMSELFLRKEGPEHYIYVLGKNGEPKSNVNVQVQIRNMKYLSVIPEVTVTLTTNKEGKVKLGLIKHMCAISVSVNLFNLNAGYFINPLNESLSYPEELDTIENEAIEFPVHFQKLNRKKISFLKLSNTNILEDLFENIQFQKQEGKFFNMIYIKNLTVGTYQLKLKSLGKTIYITVHRGTQWETDNFILKRNCLFESRVVSKPIKVASIKFEEIKDKVEKNVQIQLQDFSRDSRVHVYAIQFQPEIKDSLFWKMTQLLQDKYSKTVFPFAIWKNIFLSNRELGDEFRYVFDRKYAERVTGNCLEKPKLVMKRNFVQTTKINQEMIRQGNNYQEQLEVQQQQIAPQMQQIQRQNYAMECQNFAPMSQNIAPRSQNIARASQNRAPSSYNVANQSYDDFGGSYPTSRNQGQDMIYDSMMRGMGSEATKILEFQNFLKHAPFSLFNLTPTKEGTIQFNADLTHFTQLIVLAVDYNSTSSASIDIEMPSKIEKRDLSLITPLNIEKGFDECRTTLILKKGELHSIEDITSTEIQLIDDLSKVRGILEEIMKSQSNSTTGVFKQLEFIIKWNQFSIDEKNKKFSKFQCHELNTFLYFKDKQYFQQVVRPFIEHKMEKTFIDYYLLGDYDQIITYRSLENLQNINALEKCFLVDALMKKGNKEEAKRISDYIRLTSDTIDNKDINYFNRIFDIILNLNMLKSGANDLSQYTQLQTTTASINQSITQPSIYQDPFSNIQQMQQQMYSNYAQMSQLPMQQNQMMQQNAFDLDDMIGNVGNVVDSYSRNIGAYGEGQERFRSLAKPNNTLFGDVQQQRKNIKVQFSEIEQTNEYMETHYYKITNYNQFKSLISINSFWADYAEYLLNKPINKENQDQPCFLSGNFWRVIDNPVSAFMALAVIDLPLESVQHDFKSKGRGIDITPSQSFIIFKKEVKETELELKNEIMATHRYVMEGQSQQNQESVPEEFLSNKVYTCEIILTNASPQMKQISLLYQIPQGSLPLQMTKYMKSIPKSLQPYSTDKFAFHFYFPQTGIFKHFPTNISKDLKVISRSEINTMKVVKTPSIIKKETFRDIISGGFKEDVLEFLKTKNLLAAEKGFNVMDMLWMLKDKEFFIKVIQILRARCIFIDQVWAYAFYHRYDELTISEYFKSASQRNNQVFQQIGKIFKSKLLTKDAAMDHEFKHLDYYPMINARVHKMGDSAQAWSLNTNFKSTYDNFLMTMIEKRVLSVQDKMVFAYYLQLQDRIQESIQLFKTIDLSKGNFTDTTLKIQYDYMNAYFDFFTGAQEGFKIARSIVRQYEDYPVESWRVLFLEMLDQLNEFDGEIDEGELDAEKINTEEQKKQNYKKSVKLEPSLRAEVQEQNYKIQLDSTNIKNATIKFYIIDVEILFSRTPFLKENTEEFSYVKPCFVIEKELIHAGVVDQSQLQKVDIEIPENLRTKNMVIEINGEGKQIFKTYYSSQLKVNIIEAYGELKVTDQNDKPLPQIYIKVFQQKKGQSTSQAAFFKDGYTDIRGKFEYSQTNANKLKEVEKFAILIMSDNLGSIIKECKPPKTDSTSTTTQEQGEDVFVNQQKAERIIQKHTKCK